jgi:hypothetical protein
MDISDDELKGSDLDQDRRLRNFLARRPGRQSTCSKKLARVPVDVDYASEFRYRDPVSQKPT